MSVCDYLCVQFSKDFHPPTHSRQQEASGSNKLPLQCTFIMQDPYPQRAWPNPPPFTVCVPSHATVGDLKVAAARAFKCIYRIGRYLRVSVQLGKWITCAQNEL